MSNILSNPWWWDNVKLTETNEDITGGENGNINIPFKQLTERTLYLKQQYDILVDRIEEIKRLKQILAGGSGSTDVTNAKLTVSASHELILNGANVYYNFTQIGFRHDGNINLIKQVYKVNRNNLSDRHLVSSNNYAVNFNGGQGGLSNIPSPGAAADTDTFLYFVFFIATQADNQALAGKVPFTRNIDAGVPDSPGMVELHINTNSLFIRK